jgi:hypothetical protein
MNILAMCSLRFYGGINEIGGNKILLEDNGTRFWLSHLFHHKTLENT